MPPHPRRRARNAPRDEVQQPPHGDHRATAKLAAMRRDQGFWPSDMYMEGGDQYRGWFQSSLLVAVGALGQGSPYKECLTHGWTVDGEGRAMHKSLGNGVDPADLIKALEWVIAQNADKNSPYYGKLDIDNIAAAGMSCGGLEALHMSNDARVKTIMVMNSGYFGQGGADKESLNSMKTKSVIWILGGSTDIAYENGTDDFAQLKNEMPAFWSSLDGIGHGGTYMQPHGGDYAKVAGAWLKWQLKGDKEASTMFTGTEPAISKMAGWSFERKNIK